ncbi:MAG: double-strand break repair protein AddB [Aestuariivirga sp.]|uniref:double-strand break repair protein AddB n=1 Tax=Aestuariivirga sp. TaxID=2650926 RepID=UPI0038CFCCC0
MSAAPPRLYSIAPDKPFLEILARAVLQGFPCTDEKPPGPLDLARWTILLPTRRAVRELEDTFLRLAGGAGTLLPRIRPLGDIDEDLLAPLHPQDELGKPVSLPGQLLLLIDLIDEWASAYPATPLAREIAAAPQLATGLAMSLAEFLDTVETEDIEVAKIAALYELETARHREAILEFLGIVREGYPRRLLAANALGPQARRAAILRREARRLEFMRSDRPFIAAGSTGTIPATCALLKAIAGLANGAVVLPGLDRMMDDESWAEVGPTHPQHAMKQLLARLGASRDLVADLGPDAAPGPRAWLASELMRPAGTAEKWHGALAGKASEVTQAMQGVELVETRSIEEQAVAAALILRQCLETPGRSGCLVTPDRQLARRVKAELRRWNIDINDSAGEPLIRFGGAALLNLLIEALLGNFAALPLAALLRHELAGFGSAADDARRHVSLIELAVLRSGGGAPEIGRLAHAMRLAERPEDGRLPHLLLHGVSPAAWEEAIAHCQRITAVLAPLTASPPTTLAGHLARLTTACEAMAGDDFRRGEGGEELEAALDLLRQESHWLGACDLPRAAGIIRHLLHSLPVRPRRQPPSDLRILGLLEARLMRADVTVLAGLNEGTWPGAVDSGPWINRPMRDSLAMKQPEAQIGQTAHDFVQAFGNGDVKLLWSRRMGDSPGTPSRWILRLRTILKAAGHEPPAGPGCWTRWARALVTPAAVRPNPKPKPAPPVALRPRALSVTRIETLIRDPYAIYARYVLLLEPVKPVSAAPDPARRGIIIHGAIGDFLTNHATSLPADVFAALEQAGARRFEQIADYPGLVSFWWPRFRRAARWLADHEPQFRHGAERTVAECPGAIELNVAGEPFRLSCRADRIDLLADGAARIIDYKTGKVPSPPQVQKGMAPQLTLQAAILAQGGFAGIKARETSDIVYVHLTGGDPPGEIEDVEVKVMALARDHLAGLERLLTAYADPRQPYLPRTMMEKDDDAGGYDHLSRFQEWTLSGDLP